MRVFASRIKETIADPFKVIQSASDDQVRPCYRYYFATLVGDKYLCVVVKAQADDAFVLTAYLTDTM